MPDPKATKPGVPRRVFYDPKTNTAVDPARIKRMLEQSPLGREALRQIEETKQ